MRLYYSENAKSFAHYLRLNSTPAERRLWKYIKAKKMRGYRFLRQRAINNYIVDFICPSAKLIIEIDGDSHANKKEYDSERERYLTDLGFQVMRFLNDDILHNIEGVLSKIDRYLSEQ